MDTARKADDEWARSRNLAGPFVAGGRLAPATRLRGLLDDCMQSVCKLLSADWPSSFLQVFEDSSGAIVVSFDKVGGCSLICGCRSMPWSPFLTKVVAVASALASVTSCSSKRYCHHP